MGKSNSSQVPPTVAYLALLAVVGAGLLGLAKASDRVGVMIERHAALGIDLATDPKELLSKKPIPKGKNANEIYQASTLAPDERVRFAMLAILDGRATPSELDIAQDYINGNREEMAKLQKAALLPGFDCAPDLSAPYLAEFDPLRFGALVLASDAVLAHDASRLVPAAKIVRHASVGNFREAGFAHFWGRLYVLKASDRLGGLDPKVVTALGPEPDLRRLLRGELLHDLALARRNGNAFGIPMAAPIFGPAGESRLIRNWNRYFPQLPGEPERYGEAVTFMTEFEDHFRRGRVIRRYFREGYTDLAKLAKEARDLRIRLSHSPSVQT